MKPINRFFATLVLIAFSTASSPDWAAPLPAPQSQNETPAMKELREYKHRFLKRELNLAREQEIRFYKIYDEMDSQLMSLNLETRNLEKKVLNDPDASNTELEAAARAIFEQRKKESEIELKYYEQLSEVLTMRQLASLKSAERKLAIYLMREHKGHNK